MLTFQDTIYKISNLDMSKDITKNLEEIWIELYESEKGKRQILRKQLSDMPFMENFDLLEKMRCLENLDYFSVNEKPILNNKILSIDELEILSKKGLTNSEMETILNSIVQSSREYLIVRKIDVENESLTGLCALVSGFICSNYYKYFNIDHLKNYNLFETAFSHDFNVIHFTTINGETKSYIIDLTFRQFFLISRSIKERRYHVIENAIMPGYFIDEDLARVLLSKGYIELTNENAKKYCDAFNLTAINMKNVFSNKDIVTSETVYTGKQYVKSIKTGLNVNRH